MKQIQINLGGNSCGHDKCAPQFRLTRPIKTGPGGIPAVLIRAIERAIVFYERPALFPSLNHANGSFRQMRSERREACLVTLAACLKYMDLISLRIGIQKPEGFQPFSLSLIHRATGLSWSRFERAWSDLKNGGIVKSSQKVVRLADNEFHHEISVKTVSAGLFKALGLGAWLKHARKRSSRIMQKKTESDSSRLNLTGQGRTQLYLSGLAARIKKRCNKKAAPSSLSGPSQSTSNLSIDQRKALSSKMMQLYEIHGKTLSRDEIREMASRMI